MSSSPAKPTNRDVLFDRVIRIAQEKRASTKAASSVPEKDPNEKGTVTPPLHPAEPQINAELPGGNNSANGPATPGIETTQQGAEGVLKAEVPSTTDGNAKDDAVNSPTAKIAAKAVDIAARLNALVTKSAAAPVVKKADDTPKGESAAVPAAADPADKGTVDVKKTNGPEGLPDKGAVNTAPAQEASDKEKAANDFTLGNDALIKLAKTMLSTEDGVAAATYYVKQAKGAEFAAKAIEAAIQSQAEFDKRASVEAQAQAALNELVKGASAEDLQTMEKLAQVHGIEHARIADQTGRELANKQAGVTDAAALAKLEANAAVVFEMKKRAYAEGAAEAADMADTGAIPGGGEETSQEDIVAVLEEAVQAGEIDQALAEQILAALTGEGGEGAAPAEEGAMPAGGELPPEAAAGAPAAAEGMPAPEEAKAANAKDPIAAFVGVTKSASAEDKEAAELYRLATA